MNLDILLYLIDSLPPGKHSLLVLLGQTCRRAQAQARAVRRAALLSRVDASYCATLLQAEASISEWPHRKGNGHMAEHVTKFVRTSQQRLFSYLRFTYGLTSRFQRSTPLHEASRVARGKMLRLYNVQVKPHGKRRTGIAQGNAKALISDLSFLSCKGYETQILYYLHKCKGYETQILYYLHNVTELQAESVLKNSFVRELKQSKHVIVKDKAYGKGICGTYEFRFSSSPHQDASTGLQI